MGGRECRSRALDLRQAGKKQCPSLARSDRTKTDRTSLRNQNNTNAPRWLGCWPAAACRFRSRERAPRGTTAARRGGARGDSVSFSARDGQPSRGPFSRSAAAATLWACWLVRAARRLASHNLSIGASWPPASSRSLHVVALRPTLLATPDSSSDC